MILPIPGHQSDNVICTTKQERLYMEKGRQRESKAQTQAAAIMLGRAIS